MTGDYGAPYLERPLWVGGPTLDEAQRALNVQWRELLDAMHRPLHYRILSLLQKHAPPVKPLPRQT